jgi:hypothetical protein
MSSPRVTFALQPQVHFYKKRLLARASAVASAVQNMILPPASASASASASQEHQVEQDKPQSQDKDKQQPQPPPRLNLGTAYTSCPTYGWLGDPIESCEPLSPYVPPPPLNLSGCKGPSYGLEEPPTPRLSIGIPFSNLDTHTHDDEPTPDFANSPLSPATLEEMRNARAHEASARAEAIAHAYTGFLGTDTPQHHLTPHSQRTPASYLSTMSSPPNMSPLALSPTATPKASSGPKASFPLLPTIMSDSALNTLAIMK